MTTENRAIDELSDDEIEAAQRRADGENPDHDPADDGGDTSANTDDQGGDGQDEQGDTKPPAADDKSSQTTEAAAQPGAGAADEKQTSPPVKVEGVLSKDGQRVLPYGALQAARRDARQAESKAARAQRENEELRKQLEEFKAGRGEDIGDLTEEEIAEMEADFPERGKKLRALFDRAKAAAPATKVDQEEDSPPADDPVQEAIDQVPLLLEWQHGDAEKFARAVEHDAVLMKSPKWAGKPAVDRFAEAARRTAEEYDIDYPQAKPSSQSGDKPDTKPAAAQAPARKPPETLSDFKGGSVADHGSLDPSRATPQNLLNRMQDWSDEQIDAHLAKYG